MQTLKWAPIEDTKVLENTVQLPDNDPAVRWHSDFANVPHNPSLVLGQELFLGDQLLDMVDIESTPVRTAQAHGGQQIELLPVLIALTRDMGKRISQSLPRSTCS
jgi:hypothetical protein